MDSAISLIKDEVVVIWCACSWAPVAISEIAWFSWSMVCEVSAISVACSVFLAATSFIAWATSLVRDAVCEAWPESI